MVKWGNSSVGAPPQTLPQGGGSLVWRCSEVVNRLEVSLPVKFFLTSSMNLHEYVNTVS
jgi:hypothetical protein